MLGDSKENPLFIQNSPVKDDDWWIEELILRESDRLMLLNGSDLNDSIINAAQRLLKSQFSEIEGFQNTILAHNLKFKPTSSRTLSITIMYCLMAN